MSKLTLQVRQEGQAQELQSNKSASKKKKHYKNLLGIRIIKHHIPMKRYLYVEPKTSNSFYDTFCHSICKKAYLLSHSSQLQPYSTCDT